MAGTLDPGRPHRLPRLPEGDVHPDPDRGPELQGALLVPGGPRPRLRRARRGARHPGRAGRAAPAAGAGRHPDRGRDLRLRRPHPGAEGRVACTSRPARRWRSWAARERARARWPAWSCASSIPQEGRITIDGHDLRTVTLESLREQMMLMLQEPILFHTTVRDNIAFGAEVTRREDPGGGAAGRGRGLHPRPAPRATTPCSGRTA